MSEPQQGRDWDAIRTLTIGWAWAGAAAAGGAALAILAVASLLIGLAEILVHIAGWVN